MKFYVKEPMTLQAYLQQHLKCSARQSKRLIDARVVFVNGQRIWMSRHTLQKGDEIEVQEPLSNPSPHAEIPILYTDNDYLIVNKPAGILSNGPNSLETRLQKQTNNPNLRAMHRLDRDTSGCLIYAQHAAAFAALIPVFRAGQICKLYRAIIIGHYPVSQKQITSPIDGQTAVSRVKVLSQNEQLSYLQIQIVTGRTHQIRRHLAALGFPIVGDKQYAGSITLPPHLRQVSRQMLHAYQLSFTNPKSGREISAIAPIPEDFHIVFKALPK